MNITEFNNKFKDHLEKGHYGMSISDPEVIEFLDKEFTEEIKNNPDFKYSQIKIKWGIARLYSNSELNYHWESKIDKIMNNGKLEDFKFGGTFNPTNR